MFVRTAPPFLQEPWPPKCAKAKQDQCLESYDSGVLMQAACQALPAPPHTHGDPPAGRPILFGLFCSDQSCSNFCVCLLVRFPPLFLTASNYFFLLVVGCLSGFFSCFFQSGKFLRNIMHYFETYFIILLLSSTSSLFRLSSLRKPNFRYF